MGRLKEFTELVHVNEPAKTKILCMANNFAFSLIFFSKYNEFWADICHMTPMLRSFDDSVCNNTDKSTLETERLERMCKHVNCCNIHDNDGTWWKPSYLG